MTLVPRSQGPSRVSGMALPHQILPLLDCDRLASDTNSRSKAMNTEESLSYNTPRTAEASPSPLQQGRGSGRGSGRGVPQCRLSRGLGSRTRILAFVGLLALLLAALVSVLHGRHKPAPALGGRTVTEWLASRDYETNRAAVSLAVVTIGEASVPELRRMLRSGTRLDRLWFAKVPRWLYRVLPVLRSLHL